MCCTRGSALVSSDRTSSRLPTITVRLTPQEKQQFAELAAVEAEIGPSAYILRYRSGPLKDQRFPLTDLPDGPAVRNEAMPACSFFCEMAEQEYAA